MIFSIDINDPIYQRLNKVIKEMALADDREAFVFLIDVYLLMTKESIYNETLEMARAKTIERREIKS